MTDIKEIDEALELFPQLPGLIDQSAAPHAATQFQTAAERAARELHVPTEELAALRPSGEQQWARQLPEPVRTPAVRLYALVEKMPALVRPDQQHKIPGVVRNQILPTLQGFGGSSHRPL